MFVLLEKTRRNNQNIIFHSDTKAFKRTPFIISSSIKIFILLILFDSLKRAGDRVLFSHFQTPSLSTAHIGSSLPKNPMLLFIGREARKHHLLFLEEKNFNRSNI